MGRGRSESRGGNGGNGAVLVFENSILLIRVQRYRGLTEKWKTVITVHTLRYGVLKISEFFRGFFFFTLLVYTAPQIMVFCAMYFHSSGK